MRDTWQLCTTLLGGNATLTLAGRLHPKSDLLPAACDLRQGGITPPPEKLTTGNGTGSVAWAVVIERPPAGVAKPDIRGLRLCTLLCTLISIVGGCLVDIAGTLASNQLSS
jgi:hypothetical protein